ncbi:MAG: LysR family transcriptional activator of nhaA [Flavobacteriales bacterium]|jgi:LysR family transcriptional activator of nhaA
MPDSLNYKHLQYFWVVAHAGSIAKASERLHITPQTISGQISMLEERLGVSLFERVGRGLALTEVGKVTLQYADEIFELGQELGDVLRGAPTFGPTEFIVSAASAVPKTIVYRILEPALALDSNMKLTCKEGPVDSILADLAVHKVDLVISDQAIPSEFSIKAFNHKLGGCGVTFFASPKLARKLKGSFPNNLNNTPIILPTSQYGIRKQFDLWATEQNIYPCITGQFDDSALMKSFGERGMGVFFMPTIIATEVCKNFHVKVIGQTDDITNNFYAISAERKVRHPAVVAICEAAREMLFTH